MMFGQLKEIAAPVKQLAFFLASAMFVPGAVITASLSAVELPDGVTLVSSDGWEVIPSPTEPDAVALRIEFSEGAVYPDYLAITLQIEGPAILTYRPKGNTTPYINIDLPSEIDEFTPFNSYGAKETILLKSPVQKVTFRAYNAWNDLNFVELDQFTVEKIDYLNVSAAWDSGLQFKLLDGTATISDAYYFEGVQSLNLTNSANMTFTVMGPSFLSFYTWGSDDAYILDVGLVKFGPSLYFSWFNKSNRRVKDIEWHKHNYYIPEGSIEVGIQVVGSLWIDAFEVTPLTAFSLPEVLDLPVASISGSYGWFASPRESATGTDLALWSQWIFLMPEPDPIVMNVEGPAIVSYDAFNIRTYIQDGEPENNSLVEYFTVPSSDWMRYEVGIGPSKHVLTWKSGVKTAGLDALRLDPVDLVSAGEAVDASQLEWTSGPSGYEWWGQSRDAFDGIDAAQSTTRFNSGPSYLQTLLDGPGTLTFQWKADGSTQDSTFSLLAGDSWSGDHIQNWRTLKTAGGSAWKKEEVNIPPGRIAVDWRVEHSPHYQYGLIGFLDQVQFEPIYTDYAFRASHQQEDWMHSPWLGWYFDDNYPWIFSYGHGWQYIVGIRDQDVTVWDPGLEEWIWTGEGTYPYVYRFHDDQWYYIVTGDQPGGRWLSRISDGAWIKEQDL